MISTLHYISQGKSPEEHLENIEKACWFGADWVQLRIKNCCEQTVFETALEAIAITNDFSAKLIINDNYEIAKEVYAYGVHLGKNDACPTIARKHLYEHQIIGGTANNYNDCNNLIDKKVDYIGLGPFRETTTKKNLSPVLGIIGYTEILHELKCSIPIIAIGGITHKDLSDLLTTGIHGVAVSSAITKDFFSIKKYREQLEIVEY